jgi:LIVCS family branched-chain amino acid:cation transporter
MVTFIFSIPDVIGFISPSEQLTQITHYIPFAEHSLGWVIPALAACILVSLLTKETRAA